VMLRGINRQNIFEESEDFAMFLGMLADVKELSGILLYGYCLMGNHAHLLLRAADEDLGTACKRIGVRYALWFNRKNKRSGHLFQDRYRSEPIADDRQLLATLRYIHNNPVAAKMCRGADGYDWSSYPDYLRGSSELVDVADVLNMLAPDAQAARVKLKEFMLESAEGCLIMDVDAPARNSDEALKMRMGKICGLTKSAEFQELPLEERDRAVRLLKDGGMSIRQISRMTGISFGVVRRV